eukprot:scaffold14996_cov63-Phaeocystis_antarctica.AAC.1
MPTHLILDSEMVFFYTAEPASNGYGTWGRARPGGLVSRYKAPPFLGNLAKKSERNGRKGNPRKSDSDTGK